MNEFFLTHSFPLFHNTYCCVIHFCITIHCYTPNINACFELDTNKMTQFED